MVAERRVPIERRRERMMLARGGSASEPVGGGGRGCGEAGEGGRAGGRQLLRSRAEGGSLASTTRDQDSQPSHSQHSSQILANWEPSASRKQPGRAKIWPSENIVNKPSAAQLAPELSQHAPACPSSLPPLKTHSAWRSETVIIMYAAVPLRTTCSAMTDLTWRGRRSLIASGRGNRK